MTGALNPQPSKWGVDGLSAFFDAARSNAFASYNNLAGSYRRMVDIDDLYLALFEEFKDPEHPLGAGLALRCHSAFRAAAQLTLSGQVPEAFMVLRGALELALYAFHASTSDERAQIWMNRDEDEQTKRRCKQEFTGRRIFPALRARNADVGRVAGDLYERSIEYGAHPNARGVLTTMTHEETESEQSFVFAYLTGDGMALRFVIKSWCQNAICALDVLGLVFPERFQELRLVQRSMPMRVNL
jgi:hypothetical protein